MSFTSEHRFHTAFLASHLEALATLIASQSEGALAQADIQIPPRAVSAVLVIAEREETTIAEIADTLKQPHQLVTQRIELLSELGLIERHPDPRDGRRKLLSLTADGEALHKRLEGFLQSVCAVFTGLFSSIECDLEATIERAREQLEQKHLIHRMEEL